MVESFISDVVDFICDVAFCMTAKVWSHHLYFLGRFEKFFGTVIVCNICLQPWDLLENTATFSSQEFGGTFENRNFVQYQRVATLASSIENWSGYT